MLFNRQMSNCSCHRNNIVFRLLTKDDRMFQTNQVMIGPRENGLPSPAMALDAPDFRSQQLNVMYTCRCRKEMVNGWMRHRYQTLY